MMNSMIRRLLSAVCIASLVITAPGASALAADNHLMSEEKITEAQADLFEEAARTEKYVEDEYSDYSVEDESAGYSEEGGKVGYAESELSEVSEDEPQEII